MHLLLDENLGSSLKERLRPHTLRTTREMGWAGRDNGELLGLAEIEFDALVTADSKMQYQRPIHRYDLRVVVVRVYRTSEEHVLPVAEEIVRVLAEMKPGEVREVGPLARRR